MKIFNGEKWVSVAGDAGFVNNVLTLGGDNDRIIVVKNAEGEILGTMSKEGIDLNEATFQNIYAKNIIQSQMKVIYYVDANNGDDSNDGLTSSTAFKTIYRAIYLLKNKKILQSCVINVAAGTYNDEALWIEGMSGAGQIQIKFAKGVIINGLINITGCSNFIDIIGNETVLNQTKPDFNYAVSVNYCNHVRVSGFSVNVQDTTAYAFLAYRGATLSVKNCTISNLTHPTGSCVTAYECSRVYVDNCIGSNNAYSLWSASGSTISINGKIPYSTNGNTSSTGQIFGNATPTEVSGSVPEVPKVSKTLTLNSTSHTFWRSNIARWQTGIYIGDFGLSTQGGGKSTGANTSVFGIDLDKIRTDLKGKKITSVKVSLKRAIEGGYDSKVTPYIGLTTSTGSGSAPTVLKSLGSLGAFTKGQQKDVDLPISVVNDIITNTTAKSLVLYRPDNKQYSIWDKSLQLTINYQD